MKLKAVSGIMLTLFLICMLTLTFNVQEVETEPTTWTVDDDGLADFYTIQQAINAANDGDTIFVYNGTYYEKVVLNKTISLVGENRDATIIDGDENITPVVHITANNVTIRSFTIQNSGQIYGLEGGGIYITNSNRNNIVNNTVTNTQYGINLSNSTSNTIVGNKIIRNDVGIQFVYYYYSGNSTVYHNNFMYNDLQFSNFAASNNTWDDGYPSGGNYWRDHNPPDIYSGPYQNETGRDKIGDLPYVLDGNNTDRYPLIYLYGRVPSADLNDDGIVDIYDAILLGGSHGTQPGDLPCMINWDPRADINQDGIVDIFDALIISINFGKAV